VIIHLFRRNHAICLLALALGLALAGAGWSQTAATPAPDANPYRQAVAHLDQAEQQLTAKNLSVALTLVKQSNEIFTRLQKESAAKLAERELTAQESQQLAINQKLAAEAQAQADPLLETAAAKKKQAAELRTKGQAEAGDAAERESRDQYLQAQTLSIKSAIYALRNQQIIFRFLAP
jgi:regulator of protease activity HflC (stomatin/prohibitin superfamily)